jgi:murein DD-endopeptidase MepM/ murein hydrolase activator NlpD
MGEGTGPRPKGRHTISTRATLAAGSLLLGAIFVLAAPRAAFALSVSVPAQTPLTTDVKVNVSSTDPAGLTMLFVDGKLVRTALATARPSTLTFKAVPLSTGTHKLSALLRTSDGVVRSPAVSVRAWPPALPPKLLSKVPAGLCLPNQTLSVAVPAGITKLSVLVNGKVVTTRAIAGASTLSVPIVLPAGVDTVELRDENPNNAASTKARFVKATWPVPGHYDVSSDFGPRWGRMHKGIDIPAGEGDSVVAAGPGKVIWAENLTSYGGLIMIDHGGNQTTYYAHLSGIDVKLGQTVTLGQHIGHVGVANIAHLHFQLFLNADNANPDKYRRVNSGTPTDPYPYVKP